ncbi:hypothetical protein GCM10010178_91620 [Lentzea flava]|uniref:Uncharacterized protein n=1 Tax=Lentzea flava TaxID=103732 RepID=A0ABQ2VHQ6_9PSEU|nr:hypothetical protein [Lentzea flava]MCP2205501.1 hypothetical protein [Lentzea flava]GGU87499.1 hypothetical protein GCM10010178_91620 [Lentzea flava]
MPRSAADQPLTGPHEPWEQLADQLPEPAFSSHLRKVIAGLPVLPVNCFPLSLNTSEGAL